MMNTPAVEQLLEKDKRLCNAILISDLLEEVAWVYPKVIQAGDMDAGAWS
jgi:NADH:quinone reductase (non-electrogenic)